MSDVRYIKCKRCNRALKTKNAQLLGYGPTCYKLVQKEKLSADYHDLFTLMENGKSVR